jgi:hypothetical protein
MVTPSKGIKLKPLPKEERAWAQAPANPLKQWRTRKGFWVLELDGHVAVVQDEFCGMKSAGCREKRTGVKHYAWVDNEYFGMGKSVPTLKRRVEKHMSKIVREGRRQKAALRASQIAGGIEPAAEFEPKPGRGKG